METPEKKNGMHWLLILLVVAVVVVLLTTVLNNPSVEGTKEVVTPDEDVRQGESAPPLSEDEVADSTRSAEPVLQPTPVVDPLREPPKEPAIASGKPLYFRVVFGEDGTDSTLGVLGESGGTGTGYNVAYVDENRNGDLTDDGAKQFAKYDRGSRAGKTNPTFTFSGPFKNKASARYTLNIYSLIRNRQPVPGDYYFFWTLDAVGWNYFFINGKMRLSSSAAEALSGPPVWLAGPCQWQIGSKSRSGKVMVSAGLKDQNGCTLRSLSQSGRRLSPRLSLTKDGKVALEEDMKFG